MPRTRDLDEQRLRISEAVWSELAEHGNAGFTLRGVAARAGCTTGLVLHTFADKRALLLHARDLLHERTRARIEAIEAAASTPHDALRESLMQAVALTPEGLSEARVWVAFLAAAIDDEQLAERHRSGNRVFVARVERLLGDLPDVHARALTLVSTIEGVNALATGDPELYSPDAQRAIVDRALAAALS